MTKATDMKGLRFGRLVVVEHAGSLRNRAMWRCDCDCGGSCVRAGADLRMSKKMGKAQGCGCTHREQSVINGEANRTHGWSKTKIYYVFRQMHLRCEDPAHKDFPAWGGRGIKVCPEWNEIGAFVAWAVKSGYREGVTIERVDNMRGYSPDNCTWIPNELQGHNTRQCVYVTYEGKTQHLSAWAREKGIHVQTIIQRARKGWPPERILAKPVRR